MGMENEPPGSGSRGGTEGERSGARRAEIDIERLADKVYRLMLAEVRLAGARGGRTAQRRKF
jgi:hypothetical protein